MFNSIFDNKTVLVSGANRGIGAALVHALLMHKGIKKIYAAARNTQELPKYDRARVVPVELDITKSDQVIKAALLANDVQILINNAGVLSFSSVVAGKTEDLERDMKVNYFGTLRMVRSFAPIIEKNLGGSIINISSIVGLAPMAGIGGYSASKAALHSATQAMRAELKGKNITVHGVYPGPIDTDMSKGFEMTKTSAKETAENILMELATGKEEIYPDNMSLQLGAIYGKDPKALEIQFSSL